MEPCRLAANELACRRGERLLFAGLSLALESGSACHVTGPNGIGKSSMIRIMAGLLRPFAGSVERQGKLALLDQNVTLDEHQPLGKALDFWRHIDRAACVDLARLGLTDLLDVPVRYLSTGQRKRAAFARLLGQNGDVWLLDEPLNGLDTEAVTLVEALIAEHIASGGVALVASHQPITVAGMGKLHLPGFVPQDAYA